MTACGKPLAFPPGYDGPRTCSWHPDHAGECTNQRGDAPPPTGATCELCKRPATRTCRDGTGDTWVLCNAWNGACR